MTDEELAQLDKELIRIDESFKKTEEEGLKNILKYFDRIHDKLFTFNNILIAGYFALIKIEDSAPLLSIVIPILNLVFLIYIEYRMMERSRVESQITKISKVQRNQYGRITSNTTLYSLQIIISTFIVTIIFLYYLIF